MVDKQEVNPDILPFCLSHTKWNPLIIMFFYSGKILLQLPDLHLLNDKYSTRWAGLHKGRKPQSICIPFSWEPVFFWRPNTCANCIRRLIREGSSTIVSCVWSATSILIHSVYFKWYTVFHVVSAEPLVFYRHEGDNHRSNNLGTKSAYKLLVEPFLFLTARG